MLEKAFLDKARYYLVKWGCQPAGRPFYTHSSLLWPVKKEGHAFILKIVDADDEEANASIMLRAYEGHGAVILEKEAENVYLIECVENGGTTLESLCEQGRDEEAVEIVCDVAQKILQQAENLKSPDQLKHFSHRTEDMMNYLQ